MTTNKTYYVQIQPCGDYFLGGNRTFKTGKNDKYGKEITNYFAISNEIPQQTTILGMLRFAFLAKKDELSEDDTTKAKTIGSTGFDGSNTKPYGIINAISPLLIAKTKAENGFDFFLPAPFTKQVKEQKQDQENEQKNDEYTDIVYNQVGYKSFTNIAHENSVVLNNFDYKNFSTDLKWADSNGKIEKNIFTPLTKVGVKKISTEEGFYKQKFYRLNAGFSFGVWLTLTDDATIDLSESIIVPFGADQGMAKLTFHKEITSVFEQQQQTTTTILILSDALVDKDFFNKLDFGITDFVDFRFISSSGSGYYSPTKSLNFDLLKRGSVLYVKDETNAKHIADALRSQTEYRNIGYNYFKFI